MKKQIMKRAWEIYHTLEGDRAAKMSMALREAWAEAKTILEQVRKANAHSWSAPADLKPIVADIIKGGIEQRQREADRDKQAEALYAEFDGMTEDEAEEYAIKKRNEYESETFRHLREDDAALAEESRAHARLYMRAYRNLYNKKTRPRTIGVYDTTGANFGQIAI